MRLLEKGCKSDQRMKEERNEKGKEGKSESEREREIRCTTSPLLKEEGEGWGDFSFTENRTMSKQFLVLCSRTDI